MHERPLREAVLDALRQVAPDADLAGIDEQRSFHEQFGIDSIDFLNFAFALERTLGVRIGAADYPKLSNLAGCLHHLATLQGQRPAALDR